MSHCNICQQILADDARFCSSCGTLVGTSSATGLLPTQAMLHERYAIVQKVGQGGMGAVYKARDLHLNQRVVAIKEMSQDGLSGKDLQEAIEAFSREADLLAQLHHQSLPHIYAQFEELGRRYLVMEFIEGETLEHRMERLQQQGKRQPLSEVLAQGKALCGVLDYLHTQLPPIIFRDLKPANIMVQAPNRLYLIDFGIARLFKPGQTKDTVALGSPGYAPPEQYRQSTSPRSDIYSLGATLHQMLSGQDPAQHPFHFQPLSINQPALEQLIMSMLDLDEQQRPASVRDVLQILETIDPTTVTHSRRYRIRGSNSSTKGAGTTPAPITGPVTVCALLSPALKDQSLWRAIREQLRTLIGAFPDVTIKEVFLTGDHLTQAQAQCIDTAQLALFLLSHDFLASPACIAGIDRVIDQHAARHLAIHGISLYPCDLTGSRLAQLDLALGDVVAHRSLYAQEQRIRDAARGIRKHLARAITRKQVGRMTLLQWLLLLLYGNGSSTCPYFVVGPYALKYMRPAGLAGALVHLLDLPNNRSITEYVIGSHNDMDFSYLLPIIAPGSTQPDTVQGIAQREKPLKPIQI